MPHTGERKPSPLVMVIAACSGIAACLITVGGAPILGFLTPGYDPMNMTISMLGERGGGFTRTASIGFILIGILEIVFAAGLYLRSRGRKPAFLGSIFFVVNGAFDYIGSGLLPVDMGGLYESTTGQIHFIVSVIGMSAMILPAFFYWRVFAVEKRNPDRAVTLIAAFVIFAAAALFNYGFFTETFVGLFQRILDFAYFAWILVLSILIIPGGQNKRRTSSPG